MNKRSEVAVCLLLVLLTVAEAQAQGQEKDFSDNMNEFNPSLVVIIVILVVALFLMGFFSMYIRHCTDSPSSTVAALSGALPRRASPGLDPDLVKTFPILQYSEVKIHKIGKEALECAVCLCEFDDTQTLRLIPKCDHVFHPDCIDQWLASHTTCPVCRANLAPLPETPVGDVEAQNDAVEPAPQQHNADSQPELVLLDRTMNRNRTRSNRPTRFSRSHSTGHSLVHPGQNTERFTLRLPLELRKQLINRELQRASSLIVLPRESSSRQGYRTGAEGSGWGKISRRFDRSLKSDRWIFSLARALSLRSPRVRNNDDEATTSSSSTAPILPPTLLDSAKPPV